jgi:hypothetical protein
MTGAGSAGQGAAGQAADALWCAPRSSWLTASPFSTHDTPTSICHVIIARAELQDRRHSAQGTFPPRRVIGDRGVRSPRRRV